MIEIIAGESIKNSLLQAFDNDHSDVAGSDVTIIHLDKDESDFSKSLDIVMQKAAEGRKVLMMSFAEEILANNNKFQGAMGYPNVEFSLLPKSVSDIADEVRALIKSPGKPKDELAIELANATMPQDAIRMLKHDLPHIKNGMKEKLERWEEIARGLYGDLPFEELAKKVEEAQPSDLPSMFEGREFDGAFFDIEGTLVQNDELNEGLVKKMEEVSTTKPITIWTDGDIENYKWLREKGIMYKILPKQLFKGAKVEEAFDDLTQPEFEEKLGIKAEIFHNVEPAESLREGTNPSKLS